MLSNLRLNLLLAAITVGVLSGCATTNWGKLWDAPPKATAKSPAVQILALWQPGEGMWENRTTRGFVGQIMFFMNDNPAPAQVDGDVMVYLFDDQGTEEEQAKPLHQYHFPAETWDAFKHTGKLGLGYSVFVPYPRKGHHGAECSLRIKFTPRQGPTIYSEMVNVNLAGIVKKNAKLESDESAAEDEEAELEPEAVPVAHKTQRPAAPAKRRAAVQHALAEDLDDQVDENPARPARRKGPAAPLTESEKERIIRETRARLNAEQGQESELPPASLKQRSSKRSAHARSAEVMLAGYEDESDEEPVAPRGRRRSGTARHVLSEPVEAPETTVAAEEDDDVVFVEPPKKLAPRKSRKPARNRQESADEAGRFGGAVQGRDRFQSYTIPLE